MKINSTIKANVELTLARLPYSGLIRLVMAAIEAFDGEAAVSLGCEYGVHTHVTVKNGTVYAPQTIRTQDFEYGQAIFNPRVEEAVVIEGGCSYGSNARGYYQDDLGGGTLFLRLETSGGHFVELRFNGDRVYPVAIDLFSSQGFWADGDGVDRWREWYAILSR